MSTTSITPPLPPRMTAGDRDEDRLSLRERQQRRTHHDLIQAAIDVIGERGLEQATIQRITSRAGTSRATLYAYFPNGRNELYAQAYRTLGSWLLQRSEQLATQQSDWVGRLCSYAQAMVELASQSEIGMFYNVTGPRMTDMKYQGSGSQRTWEIFTTELEQAQRQGIIAADLDVETIAMLLVGSIREAGIHTSRDPDQADRHLKAFRQLLVALTVDHG